MDKRGFLSPPLRLFFRRLRRLRFRPPACGRAAKERKTCRRLRRRHNADMKSAQTYKNRRTREGFIAAAIEAELMDGSVAPQFMAARLRVSYNEARELIAAAKRGGIITEDNRIFPSLPHE